MITARLEDLRLGKVLGANQITDNVSLRLSIANSIDRALLSETVSGLDSYLELFREDGTIPICERIPTFDRVVEAAKDIVEVILGIERPTILTLKELIKRK